ncbi:MAG: Rieske (2Fe-2S) protein [Chloroflexota bacterium]
MTRLPVCSLGELPPGAMTWVQHGREEILVANARGHLYAMDNVCSHSGGSLADGLLRGCTVRCPLHGWEYDVSTGRCTHVPDERLATFPVVVEAGQIFVDVPER